MPAKQDTTSTKAAPKNKAAKGPAKKATPKTPAKGPAKSAVKAKMSALDAAARVLAAADGSMSTAELIETMAEQKLWQSPNGKTPAATLYAALLREITTKGADSRFQKTEPGRFAATGNGKPAAAVDAPKRTAKKAPKAKSGKQVTEPTPAAASPDQTTLSAGTPGLAST